MVKRGTVRDYYDSDMYSALFSSIEFTFILLILQNLVNWYLVLSNVVCR